MNPTSQQRGDGHRRRLRRAVAGGLGLAIAVGLLPVEGATADVVVQPELTTQQGTSAPQVGALPVDTSIASPPTATFPMAQRTGTGCTFPNVTGPSGEVVKHVAPCGSLSGNGSSTNPWRTVAQAMAALTPGQVVYVHGDGNASTIDYQESQLHPANAGTGATARIRLMAAPGESPTIGRNTSSTTSPIFNIDKAWWIVDGWSTKVNGAIVPGLTIDGSGLDISTAAVRVGSTADHVVLRGITSQNGRGPKAFFSFEGAKNAALLDSFVTDVVVNGRPSPAPLTGDYSDHHGIEVKDGAAKILVRGNESFGHNGDSFQCGEESDAGTVPPEDVTVESNRFHQDEENAADIKVCHGVTIRANKFYGYRPARPGPASDPENGSLGTRAPQGDAVVVHKSSMTTQTADRVLIEKNRFWDNSRALDLSSFVPTAVVRRNLVFSSSTANCGIGAGMKIAAKNVEVYNNTLDSLTAQSSPAPTGCFDWGDSESSALWLASPAGSRSVVWNNIVSNATRPYANSSGASTTNPQHNLLPLTYAGTVPTGWTKADPMWVADPLTNDYYTQPGSPARDAAAPVQASVSDPATYCGAPDIGFLESCS